MREPSAETTAALRRLVNGYQVSQALHVLVRLGIPDLIARDPWSASELAAATHSHEQSLYRLLRAVAAIDVVEELPERRFVLTELGHQLRSDVPGSLAGWTDKAQRITLNKLRFEPTGRTSRPSPGCATDKVHSRDS